ncbi:MAG: lipoprotein [Rhodospirillales bacterium]
MRLIAFALPLTLVGLIMVASLSGCGKKGSPERPPGSDFPRVYPNPNPSQ